MCPSPSCFHPELQVDLSAVSEQYISGCFTAEVMRVQCPRRDFPSMGSTSEWNSRKCEPHSHLENRCILRRTRICVPDTCGPKRNFSDTGHQSWVSWVPLPRSAMRADGYLHQAWLQGTLKNHRVNGSPSHILQKPAFFPQSPGRGLSPPASDSILCPPFSLRLN